MRILFFVDRLKRGGIQTLLLNLTIELMKNDHRMDIDFLNYDDGNKYELEDVLRNMGCNIWKVSIPKFSTLFKTLCELNSFFKNHNNYDLIHAHCSSKGILPLFFAKQYGIKNRIVHSHNTKFQTQNKISILIGNLLKAPLCRIATDYFACGEMAGKWLFNNVFAKKKIEVKILNNGIVLSKFVFNQNDRSTIRKQYNIPDSSILVGNIGRFSTQKNHVFLINVFNAFLKRNSNSLLMLVGEGELIETVKTLVKQLGIEKQVIFVGFRNDTHKYYQAFDLFLMPSLYEGLPFVGIEAQASGLPCLFSDSVTNELSILKTTQFLSLSETHEKWAEKLESMILKTDRQDTTKEMTIAGYNIEIEAKKLSNYYKVLIHD